MADIKRPNYFTSQFLVEKDFNDEQAYHLNMRRRHNRVLHASGVADGLVVTRFSTTQVTVSSGTAIDKNGREIALEDARTYTLTTVGNDLDVYLTLAYGELLDPADKDTQAGLTDKFFRTTERPLVQDSAAVPPSDGSVVVLARIHLSPSGTIESDGSIDPSVRSVASAKLAPASVGTGQLADGAVTLKKLANEALPLAIQGTNAITVVTDNVAKRVTVGESHSARTDNPHVTTAQQIDSQGGANRIVTQINAGTGVIAKARVEPDMVTGVVVFSNVLAGQSGVALEQFSNDIDPGLGTGPVTVQLAIDDLAAASVTTAGDTGYARPFLMRSEVNRTTGRFRIVVMRSGGGAGPARVRWTAFRAPAVPDVTVDVSVSISPPAPSLAGNVAQVLTATVGNATQGVTWSGPTGTNGTNNGTLTNLTSTSATYTSPINTGTYSVKATSIADSTKFQSIDIAVNGDITVNLSQTIANLIPGQQVTISGNVINTTVTGINWTTTGGSLSVASGAATVFTAPSAPGQYTVRAKSAADQNKFRDCVINVVAVSISVSPDANPINANTSTTVRATVTPAFAEQHVSWLLQGVGTLTPGPVNTATYAAGFVGATVTITGTSVADSNKSQSFSMVTNNVSTGPGPGGPGPGPGGKGGLVEERIATEPGLPDASAALQPATAKPATTSGASKTKPRAFITPQKRSTPKPPAESDE